MEKIKSKVPEKYDWKVQGARKEGRRGRVIGGIIMGIRKGLGGGSGQGKSC